MRLLRERIPKEQEIIIKHSLQVTNVALYLGKKLIEKGEKIDMDVVERACLLHDIAKWEEVTTGVRHWQRGGDILAELGYPEFGRLVIQHRWTSIIDEENPIDTWEEKLVLYADCRVNHDEVVSFDERLEYAKKRYPGADQILAAVEGPIRLLEKDIFERIDESPNLDELKKKNI